MTPAEKRLLDAVMSQRIDVESLSEAQNAVALERLDPAKVEAYRIAQLASFEASYRARLAAREAFGDDPTNVGGKMWSELRKLAQERGWRVD